MKLVPVSNRKLRQRAWALLAVMTLAGIGLMLLASVMNYARENCTITARNNEYFTTSYAAEAATEKILAHLSQDYQNYGLGLVAQSMASYANTLPTSSDSPYFTNYNFSGGTTANNIIVANTATAQSIVLGAPYTGLTMIANTYEIIANAQNKNTLYNVTATVGQQINLGYIPLFQFAIFYQNDMEIAPGAAMRINGAVHGNQNIYLEPQSGLILSNTVSASGRVILGEDPMDPSSRTLSAVTFGGYDLSGVDPLNLPVGTNTTGLVSNVSQNVYAILQVPTATQTTSDATGTNMLYNKADLIVVISNNNTITVTSGSDINGRATVINSNDWGKFISTNSTFYDQRDALTVNPVVVNVSNLITWSATNATLRPALTAARNNTAADVQSIYVADLRSTSNYVVTTNVSTGTNFSTNTTTTVSYPTPAGTFTMPVTTNTTPTTASTKPANGTYVPPLATNYSSTTTSSFPGAGTYQGAVTTNTTSTTTSSKPGAGTYLGSLTTNTSLVTGASSAPANGTYVGTITTNGTTHKTYTYNSITGYTYALITGYTYNGLTGYTYNLITGFTYGAITKTPWTNSTVVTNWVITSQPGIVLSNGSVLPPQGLSVATPDPAYIVGNWNIKTNYTGSSDAGLADTSYTRPSALYSDAITVLSGNWNPANSTLSLTSRAATSDTVNAAFLTGNVPSNGSYYSGGVENFPRFLENWSGQTFTYNGSMVAMFASQIANAHWPNTGTVYNPPTRNWSFDNNFANPAKQPPMQPQVISVNRGKWVLLPPRATVF